MIFRFVLIILTNTYFLKADDWVPINKPNPLTSEIEISELILSEKQPLIWNIFDVNKNKQKRNDRLNYGSIYRRKFISEKDRLENDSRTKFHSFNQFEDKQPIPFNKGITKNFSLIQDSNDYFHFEKEDENNNEEGSLKAALSTLWSHKENGFQNTIGNELDVNEAWINILKNSLNNRYNSSKKSPNSNFDQIKKNERNTNMELFESKHEFDSNKPIKTQYHSTNHRTGNRTKQYQSTNPRTGNRWIRSGNFNRKILPGIQLVRPKDSFYDLNLDTKKVNSRFGIISDHNSQRPTPNYNKFRPSFKLQQNDKFDYDYTADYIDDDYGIYDSSSEQIMTFLPVPTASDVDTNDTIMAASGSSISRLFQNIPRFPSIMPRFDTAVTVMSFVAFSVFVTNLAVKAFLNGTGPAVIVNAGRDDSSFRGVPSDIQSTINQFSSSFLFLNSETENNSNDIPALNLKHLRKFFQDFSSEIPSDLMLSDFSPTFLIKTINSMFNIGNVVYANLHEMAKFGVSKLSDSLNEFEILTKNGKNQEKTNSGDEIVSDFDVNQNFSLGCKRRLLCKIHQIIRTEYKGNSSYTLLPYWTFGMNWLNTEHEQRLQHTPTLLENLRAEIAGQSGKNCRNIYPDCPDSREFHQILEELTEEFQKNNQNQSENDKKL